jgi:trigger factor
VTEQDLDKVLEKLRHQYVKWHDVSRPAKTEDRLTIDFDGFVDNKKFEGGTAKDVAVILGSKSMIPGFEEGLIGAKAGDTVELT